MQTLRSGTPGGALITVLPFGSQLFLGLNGRQLWCKFITHRLITIRRIITMHNRKSL